MTERGQYAEAIREAVESICSTAARLSNLLGPGQSIRFSDMRLRQGAEEILGKLKRFDDLDEYDKILDEQQRRLDEEKLEMAKRQADLDVRERDIVKSLSGLSLLESRSAENLPQLEALKAENDELKRQIAELKGQMRGMEEDFGVREIDPLEATNRDSRIRHRPSTFTMLSGPPAKRRSIEPDEDTPRGRIERTPARSIINTPSMQPLKQAQTPNPRSSTKMVYPTDASWNLIDWSELGMHSRDEVKRWFVERAEKLSEKAQADTLRLGAKGADYECHHNRWHRKHPHSKRQFSEKRWCPTRVDHACFWIEAIPDVSEDTEIQYRAHLRS